MWSTETANKNESPEIRAASSWQKPLFGPGDVIDGNWVISELLARRSACEVYLARNADLGVRASMRIISHKSIRAISANNREFENCVERFRKEFQILARIHHPNVIEIYGYGSLSVVRDGERDVVDYTAMQYLEGRTLRSTMPGFGFYPNEERAREWLSLYYLFLLDGVSALHENGIIHRDLKPDNILLDGKIPKISDFPPPRSQRPGRPARTFELNGTLDYIYPEGLSDLKGTDERTDVYSLGKILAEAVTGKLAHQELPFPFRTVRSPSPKTVFFRRLDAIIQEATCEKEMRLPSVRDLKESIRSLLLDPGVRIFKNENIRKGPPFSWDTVLLAITLFLAVVGSILIWRMFLL